MAIGLRHAPAAPVNPGGSDLRVFRPGIDDRAAFDAMEDAFGEHWDQPHGSRERFNARFAAPGTDPELMLLAWDGDDLAGQCWAHRVDDGAWIDALGVGKRWRGRGLGRFLLPSAFSAVRDRGATRAGLSVDAENASGATRPYLGAGMRILHAYEVMRRELRPGIDPTANRDS